VATTAPVAAPAASPKVIHASPLPDSSPTREHGGFYLGFHAGPGYFNATSEWEGDFTLEAGTREFTGPTLGIWLAVGTVFAKRVALAALLSFEPVLSLSGNDETGATMDLEGTSFALHCQGLLVDYYLSPEGGLHLLGAVGFSQLKVSRPPADQTSDPSGSFWALGAGYEWWVADEATLGVVSRVTAASLESRESSERADLDVYTFGLHVVATVN
jgi:hypothetical protein